MLNIPKIKEKMLAQNISAEVLAEVCGVPSESVISWLSGKKYPRLSKLVLISRRLHMPLPAMLLETKSMPAPHIA